MMTETLNWDLYGDHGWQAKTEFGTYTIVPRNLGFECGFHFMCCRQINKVVPGRTSLEETKHRALEHHLMLQKRVEVIGGA